MIILYEPIKIVICIHTNTIKYYQLIHTALYYLHIQLTHKMSYESVSICEYIFNFVSVYIKCIYHSLFIYLAYYYISTPKVLAEPSTPNVIAEPSTPNVIAEPSTPKVLAEPSTPKVLAEPSTPKVLAEPSTPKVLAEPSTPKVLAEPKFTAKLKENQTNFLLVQEVVSTICKVNNLKFADIWYIISDRECNYFERHFIREKLRNNPLNQVKKPRTAFSFFTQANRNDIQRKHITLSFGEVSKLVGEQWKNLDEISRAKYIQLEADDKARYTNERQKIIDANPEYANLVYAAPAYINQEFETELSTTE
jgi:hypothetical protein